MQTTSVYSTKASSATPLNAPTNLDTFTQADGDKPTFTDLGLAKPILTSLHKSGYINPTPIQQGAIPPSMAGRDLLLSAQTGSGKTAAFVLPILDRIIKNNQDVKMVRALILTPTRELALQVQDNVRNYSSAARGIFSVALVGGAPYSGQIRALRKGVQIIVATPGRLIDHLSDGRIDLSNLDVLVLDEADRMLDMGFSEAIDTIIKATPSTRQTVMSSATWDGAVGKIAESFTTDPCRVSIKVESAHIDESVYFCDDFRHKNDILHEVLNNPKINQAVIFAATKMSAEKLAGELNDKGYKARYLHGDLPQGKRNRIVSDVKAGKCQFLVATDVAARGIDIATISHVINYDLPRQAEDYVHRIGRCGRAGRSGMAINLCSMDDRGQFFAINRYLGRQMKTATIVGLEPKRNFGEDERRLAKRGDKRRKNSASFGRKGQTDRYAHRQATPSIVDGENRWQDNKDKKPSRSKGYIQSSTKAGFHQERTKSDNKPSKGRQGDFAVRRHSESIKKSKPKAAVEMVFNQTAKKRRFGDK